MRILLLLLCLCLPFAATAQDAEDDRGYLAGLLEDALGGDGRTIRINGFEGAFSSAASIQEITVADADGIWLTLSDVVIDWNRAALLRGGIEVNTLSAARIDLPRLPRASGPDLPDPEATPFALPDLPVSVRIGALNVATVALGAPVLGQAARLSLTGSAQLAEGSGTVALLADRIDDTPGTFALEAGFQAAARALNIDLALEEDADGLVTRLLDLPGAPSLSLTVAGAGTLSDFTADIALATDGIERLGGVVTLLEVAPDTEDAPAPLGFEATLSGDVTALFLPEYRAFFGDDVALMVRGERAPDGALTLEDLTLRARALSLQGRAALNADAWPTLLRLDGEIAQDNGPVLLPVSGGQTRIDRARVRLRYDASQGDAFQGGIQIAGLNRSDIQIAETSLGARGTLSGDVNAIGQVIAALRFSANGITFADAGVAQAIGQDVTGTLDVAYRDGVPLALSNLAVDGAAWALRGAATIDALSNGLQTDFATDLEARDLAVFAPLAGQPLGGAARLRAEGSAALGGFFDVRVTGQTDALTVGVPQVDALMRARTQLDLAAQRDERGLTIERLNVENPQLAAQADGTLVSDSAALSFETRLADVGVLTPAVSGPVSVSGTANQQQGRWQIDTRVAGPYRSTADLSVTVAPDDIALSYNAFLPDVSPLVTALSGPVRLDGTARQQGASWALDTTVDGPAGTSSRVAGTVAPDAGLALDITGSAPLALANPVLTPNNIQGTATFDLSVNGPAALGSVSGTIRTSGTRLTAPGLPIGFGDIDATVGLRNGIANIQSTLGVAEGGTLTATGPITLSGSFPADLRIGLNDVAIVDPTLYETSLDGTISVIGPLQGGARISGRIDVGETLVQVPSTGISTFGEIPLITHEGAPRPVMRTLGRADLLPDPQAASARAGPVYPLDIQVVAPARIFVRGRGLDAELGGQLRLMGTTADILSSGRFELIRGSLEVLSKRFDLDEGAIQLQGNFDPTLRFVATTQTDSGTASVVLDGPASQPTVRFEASPDAPEDQILAQVFFGRDAAQLSAFQALQLANSVAVLAGRGGVGIVSNLRQSFDLDDLDISTDEEGNAAVRAGKYLSDNVYTDVTVGGDGGAGVSLNIDLTPNITAKGGVEATGNTSLGIFFERDY